MKKMLLMPLALIALLVLILIFADYKPAEVTDFESCEAHGYPVMESYPRQCRAGGITYVEEIEIKCLPEERNVDACTAIYEPVCAKVNVQCIRAPCEPVRETFPNRCEACKNELVESYKPGECMQG